MLSDKITEEADWKDGICTFREKCTKDIIYLKAQIDMIMQRIKDLEQPPKAPHPPRQEEEMKL